MRALLCIIFLVFAGTAVAQDNPNVRLDDEPVSPVAPPKIEARPSTGGALTREDIMARQRGEEVDTTFRREFGDPDSAAGIAHQLGTLGGASFAVFWRALRFI